jgi:hypothetical protein
MPSVTTCYRTTSVAGQVLSKDIVCSRTTDIVGYYMSQDTINIRMSNFTSKVPFSTRPSRPAHDDGLYFSAVCAADV